MITFGDVEIGELYVLNYKNCNELHVVLVLDKKIEKFETETLETADFLFLDTLKVSTYFLDRLNDVFELVPLEDAKP